MNTSASIDFDGLFPDVRETGETRLRQSQLVMLRLLKILDYLCTRHNIQYFLTGGSLLGAIRHQGFIPWDDDLDVGMKRKDYERFVQLAVPELPHDIFFQNTDTDPYYPLYHQAEAKLRDKYSRYFRSPELEKKHRWHNGIQLDIFVYDRAFLPHNYFIYLVNWTFIRYLKRFKKKNLRARVLQLIEKYVPLPLVYASGFIERRSLVGSGTNFIKPDELKRFERVRFEDMKAFVSSAWDACLKRQYGDYMKLPSEGERKGLHSIKDADPFTPCNHKEILHWENKKNHGKAHC